MNKPFLVVAGGLLASMVAAAGASAGVTSVVTGQTVYSGIPGGAASAVASSATQLSVVGEGGPGYNNYQVSTAVNPTDIIFADNATALGSLSSLTTSTFVNITFTNNGSTGVVPTLQSQIIPGGFGLYVGDPGLNPTFKNGVVGDANQTPEVIGASSCGCVADTQLNQFASGPGNYMAPGYYNAIAGVSFAFTISSNGVTLEDISGSLTLAYDPVTKAPVTTLTLSPDAVAALPSFGLASSAGDPSALGYRWDANTLSVALGGLLAPGESQTVSYDTTVTAYTLAGLSVVYQDGKGNYYDYPQLVAYSGFGDPIGKGTPPVARILGAMDPSGIQDVYFPRFQIGLPTFDPVTGNLSLPVSKDLLPALPLTYSEATIPEPETWTLLLAGLGIAGFALRRRPSRRLA